MSDGHVRMGLTHRGRLQRLVGRGEHVLVLQPRLFGVVVQLVPQELERGLRHSSTQWQRGHVSSATHRVEGG